MYDASSVAADLVCRGPPLCITAGIFTLVLRWREGFVTAVTGGWPGAVLLDVCVSAGPDSALAPAAGAAGRVPALAYSAMVGEPISGDRVLLNLNAYTLGLGTGGYALVVAMPDRLPPDAPLPHDPLVKARYTPHQAVVAPFTPTVDDLAGMPVVVADLHSALPAIVAGLLAGRPMSRVAYVMTDGGALPTWFSRTVAALRPRLATVISTGQAFGGDVEAVNVHSGLLAARSLGADVAVVAQGPGNLGTGTAWGFSGTSAGEAVNAASVLGGRPVGALRLSGADTRPRHRGISHHSMTAYGRVALAPADLVLPLDLPPDLALTLEADIAQLPARHRVVRVPTTALVPALRSIAAELCTMGRDFETDPWYFLTCAAAGAHAATLLP
jgi:hypothetical protein